MSDQRKLPAFPTSDDREFGYGVAKFSLGAIPGLGPAAQEILEKLVGNPLRRRQEDWFRVLAEELHRLDDQVGGISLDKLSEDEVFISIVAEATQQAMRTHNASKRAALRNVVLNAAAGVRLNEALVGAFLSFVERFSEAHIKLLTILRDLGKDEAYLRSIQNVTMGSVRQSLLQAHPDLDDASGIFSHIYEDLIREKLTNDSISVTMSGQGLREPQITDRGRAFLKFIEEPVSAES